MELLSTPFAPEKNTSDYAASAMYRSAGKLKNRLPYYACATLTDYIEYLWHTEMPYGASTEAWRKQLKEKTMEKSYQMGIVPTGFIIVNFFLPVLAKVVFSRLLDVVIDRWLENDGNWVCDDYN